jgi:hypothetical protein
MTQLDISPDELENLSNVELLDLLEEIYVEFYIGNIEDEI